MALFTYNKPEGQYNRSVNGFTAQGKLTFGVPLFLILFFIFCFRTVGAGSVGIITRFGEINRVANSGIALKLPWPIERLEKMEIRVQKEEQTATAATADLQDVSAALALNYAIDSSTALRIYKELGKDYKDRVVVPAVQESFKSASAKYTASQLVTERTAVKGDAYEVIKSRLGKYGIRVVDLNIVNFNFSAEFNKALEAKQVAAQQAEQAKFLVEKARNEGEATIVGAQAHATAQGLLRQTLTPEILQKMAIEKWNGQAPQAMGQGMIFNIPITR